MGTFKVASSHIWVPTLHGNATIRNNNPHFFMAGSVTSRASTGIASTHSALKTVRQATTSFAKVFAARRREKPGGLRGFSPFVFPMATQVRVAKGMCRDAGAANHPAFMLASETLSS
jgi:hypothetical protein